MNYLFGKKLRKVMKEQLTNLINNVWVEREDHFWEITTRRLAVLYITDHYMDPPSLRSLYECYKWIDEIVNTTYLHGITEEYCEFFNTHDPHTIMLVIGQEFQFIDEITKRK